MMILTLRYCFCGRYVAGLGGWECEDSDPLMACLRVIRANIEECG